MSLKTARSPPVALPLLLILLVLVLVLVLVLLLAAEAETCAWRSLASSEAPDTERAHRLSE